MTSIFLEARNLGKTFTVEDRTISVLDNVSFTIDAGKFVVIRGSSGSGKSTLLSLLSGLDTPSTGSIIIDKTDITHLSEDALAPLRNQTMGYVFQSFHLVPSLTAKENIMFPAELAADKKASSNADDLLRQTGLTHRANSFPHQLSGGEKQRVAICRALINRPKVIFADEPTGNLDSKNSDAVMDVLLALQKAHQTTLVLVTHDAGIATLADEVIELVDGKLV